MRPESAAALYDMSVAAERIEEATIGLEFGMYESTWIVQSAVERQLGILGEALVRIRDLEPPLFRRFPEAEKVVGLRNLIIHGYDAIDPKVIWAIVQERLPAMRELLRELMAEAEREGL